MGLKSFLLKFQVFQDLKRHRRYKRIRKAGDAEIIKQNFRFFFNREIDLDNPQTLNEKIQWLKLNDRKDIYTVWADKYGSRKYIAEQFGEEYLVPLLFKTNRVRKINKRNINEFPCVVKSNHSSGDVHLYHSPDQVDWKQLRKDCRNSLKTDYYLESQEWQYKNIKRYIIVEKMLLDKNGSIPNDYKLHFIEGKLAFVYCSIDREKSNYRQIYDPDWNVLPFRWDGKNEKQTNFNPIPKPVTFDKMLEIGMHFAKQMHYVRVDFYEVDGKLYCGEITLHHGSGYDRFVPDEYDLKYGKMLKVK